VGYCLIEALTSDHKIVVMSADKGEIMEPITNMVRLMQITMGALSHHLLSGCIGFDKHDHKTNSPADLYYYENS